MFKRDGDKYHSIYLEVDGDPIDEMAIDEFGDWMISFSSGSGYISRVELWHLTNRNPNVERIRVATLDGASTSGRQLNPKFGERHIELSDGKVVASCGNKLIQFEVDLHVWRSIARSFVGRNLTQKEIREHLGDDRGIESVFTDWTRPLSIEKWEGTH